VVCRPTFQGLAREFASVVTGDTEGLISRSALALLSAIATFAPSRSDQLLTFSRELVGNRQDPEGSAAANFSLTKSIDQH
jgi:hypothetical protein